MYTIYNMLEGLDMILILWKFQALKISVKTLSYNEPFHFYFGLNNEFLRKSGFTDHQIYILELYLQKFSQKSRKPLFVLNDIFLYFRG